MACLESEKAQKSCIAMEFGARNEKMPQGIVELGGYWYIDCYSQYKRTCY